MSFRPKNALAIFAFLMFSMACANAQTVRIAHYNVGLDRDGPGLLLQDILKNKDDQIAAVVKIITKLQPDILVLNGFDNDADLFALGAFAQRLRGEGLDLRHLFAPAQNSGVASGLDLNGNGYLGDGADALGFGDFWGQGAMALLSRYPIDVDGVQDFTSFLWRDMIDPSLPAKENGNPYYSAKVTAKLPLHSHGAWVVPIKTSLGKLEILVSHSTPPVFDGPEDRNGLRNADQARFWLHFLDGKIGNVSESFVAALGLNADPYDGDGAVEVVRELLQHPKVIDPHQSSIGAAQAGAGSPHETPDSEDTADWREPNPGNLRVDFILPSKTLTVIDSGVFWPAETEEGAALVDAAQAAGTRHKLVWLDVALP